MVDKIIINKKNLKSRRIAEKINRSCYSVQKLLYWESKSLLDVHKRWDFNNFKKNCDNKFAWKEKVLYLW